MNKQEALEAMLTECRGYETPDGQDTPDGAQRAGRALLDSADRLRTEELGYETRRAHAVRAAGALLYLLIDDRSAS